MNIPPSRRTLAWLGTAALALSLLTAPALAQVQASRPFDQPGPTGDNRAATGNPATQVPPSGHARDEALKRPQRAVPRADGQRRAGQSEGNAPQYLTPGAPAEDDVGQRKN
jgi:hypothetical protein